MAVVAQQKNGSISYYFSLYFAQHENQGKSPLVMGFCGGCYSVVAQQKWFNYEGIPSKVVLKLEFRTAV